MKKTFPNRNQIENHNMTVLLLKKSLNPFYVSVSNFNGIKTDARSTVLLFYCLNKWELTLLGILNKLNTTHDHNLSSLIQNNNYISITDLLLNSGIQEWQGLELIKNRLWQMLIIQKIVIPKTFSKRPCVNVSMYNSATVNLLDDFRQLNYDPWKWWRHWEI